MRFNTTAQALEQSFLLSHIFGFAPRTSRRGSVLSDEFHLNPKVLSCCFQPLNDVSERPEVIALILFPLSLLSLMWVMSPTIISLTFFSRQSLTKRWMIVLMACLNLRCLFKYNFLRCFDVFLSLTRFSSDWCSEILWFKYQSESRGFPLNAMLCLSPSIHAVMMFITPKSTNAFLGEIVCLGWSISTLWCAYHLPVRSS